MSITHEMVREAVEQARKAAATLPFCKDAYFHRLGTVEEFLPLGLSPTVLMEMVSDLLSAASALQQLQAVTAENHSSDGFLGTELKSSSSERWAFISPEPGKEGMYRATFFDMSGFTNHHCDARPDELLWSLVDMGFMKPEPGALDRIAAGEPWAKGLRWTERVLAHSRGRLSTAELYQPL